MSTETKIACNREKFFQEEVLWMNPCLQESHFLCLRKKASQSLLEL